MTGTTAERVRPLLRAAGSRFGPAVAGYLVLKALGLLVFLTLLAYSGDFRGRSVRFGGGAHPYDVLGTWDGWWYQQVAQLGYHPVLLANPGGEVGATVVQNSAAFFPLYPGLMRLVSEVTGLGLFGSGLLVSVVGSVVAATGIFALVDRLAGRRAGVVAACLWAIAPGSGVEWAVYSDALFVALAAWSCYCVMTRRWLLAGLLTLVAGLSRPTSAALIAAVGVAALIAVCRREDGVLRPLAAMALAPLGLVGYLGWVGWRTGRPDGYLVLQRDAWNHYFDFGRGAARAMLGVMLGRSDYPHAFPVADLLAALLVLALPVLLVLLVRLRPPPVLTVYTLATIVTALGSLGFFCNTSRYLLVAFPLFLPVATAMARLRWSVLAVVLVTGALASGWYGGYAIFELGIP